jgi:signal transduction histidine kinase
VAGNYAASAFSVFALWRANKTGSFKRYFLITVIVVFIVIFPILFFMGGGIISGMPSFFIFAVVFTVIMLEGRRRIVFTVLEFALYAGCFLTVWVFPEIAVPFPAEAGMKKDVIVACLASSVVLAIAIYQHIVVYDRKQKELEKANESLADMDRQKTEFLQNISHDLRTPLSNICNYALDTLMELGREQLNVPEMEYGQNRIRAEGERLTRMVNQLMDVAAIEGGRMKIQKEPISLAALLSRMADGNTAALNERGNRAALEIQDGLPDINADADAMERVLSNILSNALRHTRQGVITMSLTAGGGYQEVRVSDTGEGLYPEVRSQAFLRYIERKEKMTGQSGMGLYICKKLIDAHGGEIGIESERGKGAAVWFRLPASGTEAKK